jgi:nitrate/nitrite-specific signal transduction histidine kinase
MKRLKLFFLIIIFFSSSQAQQIKLIDIKIIGNRNSFKVATNQKISISNTNTVTLEYGQNSFTVNFKDFLNQRSKYQLQNFSSEWFETSEESIHFTNLPSGEYFLVIAPLSIKNIAPAHLKIIIEAPIWLRWWFLPMIFLYLLILVSIFLYFLFQYRLRQQLRTQLIRDAIARDLHDDIGSYLGSISILSQNVDSLILKNPEKARQSLSKIGVTARNVMETMSDIVWSINPSKDSMEEVLVRMKDFANELFFDEDVVINFQISESLYKVILSLEKRRDFYLIFKEALHNISKYAKANQINISIEKLDNQLIMNIQDNGIGIDGSKKESNRNLGGNGVNNMKTRAEKLGGTLKIESKINEGTTIELTFEVS